MSKVCVEQECLVMCGPLNVRVLQVHALILCIYSLREGGQAELLTAPVRHEITPYFHTLVKGSNYDRD